MYFVALLLACAMSTDAFIFGISFAAKGIKISIPSLFIVTFSGLGVLLAASVVGSAINQYVYYGNVVGAFILIGVGMWLCSDSDEDIKSVLDNPEKADINKSNNIEPIEAIITGVVLSIDSAAIVAGSAMDKISLYMLPVMVLIFQIVFMITGMKIAQSNIHKIPQRTISILSGFVIVLMGLYKLSRVFC